jgi:hypothetical protein
MPKMHISIKVVDGDLAHGGVTVDEYSAVYDLDNTADRTRGIAARLRTLIRRELIRLSLIVPTEEDLKRVR